MSCPYRSLQPLYCVACNNEEPPRHNHRTKEISVQNTSFLEQWMSLRKVINTKAAVVSDWLQQYESLLDIFVKVLGSNSFKKSLKALLELNKEFE